MRLATPACDAGYRLVILYNYNLNSIFSLHPYSLRYSKESLKELRQKTANYMRTNKDDFLPFTSSPNTGDMLNNGKVFGGFIVREFFSQY